MRWRRATPTDRHMPARRAPPLVSCPRCEGVSYVHRGLARQRLRGAHRRLWWRNTSGRARTGCDLHRRGRPSELPRRAGGRAPGHAGAGGAQHEHGHDSERRGHDRLVQLCIQLARTGLEQATDLGDRTGPRRGSQTPGAEPGHQPTGGRPDRLREHLGAGPLPPGATRTFAWRVTPVKPGLYTVHYTIAAGLAGRSRARLADGAIPHGHFTVAIAPRPPATHVNPATGQVEPGRYEPGTSVAGG